MCFQNNGCLWLIVILILLFCCCDMGGSTNCCHNHGNDHEGCSCCLAKQEKSGARCVLLFLYSKARTSP